MKPYLLALCCALLMGCEYTVPLFSTPQQKIDPALVGQWSRTLPNGETETVLVLPWSDQEYLVAFPANKPDAMYARATLMPVAGLPLIQLHWIGTANAKLPTDARVYQFATFACQNDRITLRLLNSERIRTSLATSDALIQAITKNKEAPDLFREPLCFSRVTPH